MKTSRFVNGREHSTRGPRLLALLSWALFAAACGNNGPTVDAGATGNDGSSAADLMAQRHPSGPKIISLSTNADSLRDGDALVVTAIVTDPDGSEDLLGGELRSTTGKTYGTFQDSSGEGAYSLTLTWAQLGLVERIHDFTQAQRTFAAHFFDKDGHETIDGFAVNLLCEGTDHRFCDAACVDLQSDPSNCGACETSVGKDQACRDGAPTCERENYIVCGEECRFPGNDANCGACDNGCTKNAETLGATNPVCQRELSYPPYNYFCGYSFGDVDKTHTCAEICNDYGLGCHHGYASGRELTCDEYAPELATFLDCRCRDL